MSINIPTPEEFSELTKSRNEASVSLYIASGWSGTHTTRQAIVHDPETAQTALRSAANIALGELKEAGVSQADRDRIQDFLNELDANRLFWSTQARTIAVFVSPEKIHSYRLMNELPQHSAVGDRFDIGALLRATTFAHNGYVLALTEGNVRLVYLDSDASGREIELTELPEDASEVLEPNIIPTGRFDRHRADGTLGPKVEQRRYCSIVQDAVLAAIGSHTAPLVLLAASDLEPAYREINTYSGLLKHRSEVNPSSLSLDDLKKRGRAILDEHFDQKLADWREKFGSLQANGLASDQLSDISRAAISGLVDTMLFDLENNDEGTIDEAGTITFADQSGPQTYGLIDEIAARVLRTGGTVRAVRTEDLPEGTFVAATFRATP